MAKARYKWCVGAVGPKGVYVGWAQGGCGCGLVLEVFMWVGTKCMWVRPARGVCGRVFAREAFRVVVRDRIRDV